MRGALRFACLALALLLLGGGAIRWGGWWRVVEVKVTGDHHLPPKLRAQLTHIVSSANILRLDLRGFRDRILSLPWVREVQLGVDPVGRRIRIYVWEREPVGRVAYEGGTEVWVDDEGVVVGQADQAWLVVAPGQGGWVSLEVAQAAEAVEGVDPALLSLIAPINATDPQAVVAEPPLGPRIRFGPIGNLPQRLAILEELWEEQLAGRFNFSSYAEVDLRWEGQVILKPR